MNSKNPFEAQQRALKEESKAFFEDNIQIAKKFIKIYLFLAGLSNFYSAYMLYHGSYDLFKEYSHLIYPY